MEGERANVRLYAYLLTRVAEPEVRQVFERLQHASLYSHLPAFERAVAAAQAQESYHAAHGIPSDQAYVQHGPLSDVLEKALAGFGAMGAVGPMLGSLIRRASPAMLTGVLVGGASVLLLKNRTNHKKGF